MLFFKDLESWEVEHVGFAIVFSVSGSWDIDHVDFYCFFINFERWELEHINYIVQGFFKVKGGRQNERGSRHQRCMIIKPG